MGRGRILNRKEMRADYDAAERRKGDDEEQEEVEGEEEEDDDEAEEEEAPETDEEAAEGEDDDEDEEVVKPKKKKVVKPKAPPKRTRAAKVVRMKVIWGVFSNSNQRVAVFDYPKKKEAEELAAKLTADKKNTHFVQPVKEPIEEK